MSIITAASGCSSIIDNMSVVFALANSNTEASGAPLMFFVY